MLNVEIRDLTTHDDCLRVVALEKDVWGYSDGEDVVPAAVLIVSIKRGGILLGAFAGQDMKGFVYSVPAVKDGRLTQWSHMLGVTEDARGGGLGLRLKLAQRDRSIAMGVDLIEWTFDPLQALNARLNVARLGAVVEEYEENVYGESSSRLHRGTPTDRFVAAWHVTAPHVARRLAMPVIQAVRDATLASASVVNPSKPGHPWPRPGVADLDVDARRLFVEIPTGFSDLLQQDPSLALEWRLATRAVFQRYLALGYRVVDFFLSQPTGRGHYLLVKER